MTKNEIQKLIFIKSWAINEKGIELNYLLKGALKTVYLLPHVAAAELCGIGSIDEFHENRKGDIIIHNPDSFEPWAEFAKKFKLSQLEALKLCVNNEYTLAIEKEIDAGDIGKAIRNIIG